MTEVQEIDGKLKVWADDLDEATLEQALRTARLAIVAGHVALMPDAHLGLGATVGSVVPTDGAVIPSCVGVDIGCGMAAVLTDITAADLPDDLGPLLSAVERVVPAGVGEGHGKPGAGEWLATHRPRTELTGKLAEKASTQIGTLGSGNHFVEVSLDGRDRVWVVLHSGSRGVGYALAQAHIEVAKAVAKREGIHLEDQNLAYLREGTPEFDHYLADLRFAQDYARINRETMLDAVLGEVFRFVRRGREMDRVNCHHNYTQRERHFGRELWITRKGAIGADIGERGIIPGSMGTDTYLVEGLGNPDSYRSSAHGAGRRMSRTKARKTFDGASLARAMEGRSWLVGAAGKLVDEHPGAYKDIDEVMRLSADLVTVTERLQAILNYKGT